MNHDSNQGLESVGNDAFEARLVAWVLGEASAFERTELETLYREDREVALFVDRLRLLDGLIKEEGEDVWRLSEEKRAAVLALMEDESPVVVRRSRRSWWSVAAAAAVMIIAIGGALAPMAIRRAEPMMKESAVVVNYSAPRPQLASPSGAVTSGGRFIFPTEYEPPSAPPVDREDVFFESSLAAMPAEGAELEEQVVGVGGGLLSAIPATPATPAAPAGQSMAWGGGMGDSLEDPNQPVELGVDASVITGAAVQFDGGVERMPSAPSSNVSGVIASNSARPMAIPVPARESGLADGTVHFGDGDDFGDGWGSGAMAGGGGGDVSGEAGVPELGDVPAMGFLFRSENEKLNEPSGGVDDAFASAETAPSVDPFADADPFAGSGESLNRDAIIVNDDASGGIAGVPPAMAGEGESSDFAAFGLEVESGETFKGRKVSGGQATEEVRYAIDGVVAELADDALQREEAPPVTPAFWDAGELEGMSGANPKKSASTTTSRFSDSLDAVLQREVVDSDQRLQDGRGESVDGEVEMARQLGEERLGLLPEQSEVESRRKLLRDSLEDEEIAVVQDKRRAGRQGEAKDLSEKAKKQTAHPQLGQDELARLNAPIKAKPAPTEVNGRQLEEVRRGLYMGEGHYNLGQFDKAQEEYEAVLRTDPENQVARRGMEQVNSARESYYRSAYDHTRAELLAQVDSGWEVKEALGENEALGNGVATGDVTGTAKMSNVLEDIVIPEIDFEDVSLEEAVDFLRVKSVEGDRLELDPEKKGLAIRVKQQDSNGLELQDGLDAGGEPAGGTRIEGLKLKNVPLGEALNYVAESTRTRWSLEEGGVVFKPATEVGEDLMTRTFTVPPDFASRLLADQVVDADADPFAQPDDGQALLGRTSMAEMLMANGVRFGRDAKVQFFPETSTLLVRNTPANLDLVDQLTQSLNAEATADAPLERMDEVSAADEPFSTFSLHVSDSSFKLAAAAMERGEVPDAEGIRPEEFYNAFDYGDPAPAATEPVACVFEQSAHPAFPQRNLMRVAVRTGSAGRAQTTPLNLTLLLDNSGSMEREDRAAGVGQAVEQLATLLQPGDKVTVAGFSRQPRLLVDRLDGGQAAQLNGVVAQLPSEGGTNLEEALVLGEELAKRQFVEGAQNRVVLFTDGAANLGDADPESLNGRIEGLRQNGISFDAAGFGADGLNDRLLERLTRNGNGRYYVVDEPEEAGEGFADKLAGAFRPQAENVKVQVVFNPSRVGQYKLIGFEKHRLKKEDFRNDSVDAAEMASEEAGVALYQFEVLPEGEGEIGEVSVRFRDVSTGEMVERTWTIPYDSAAPAFDQAAESLQLAGLAALAAEKLRAAPMSEMVDLGELAPVMGRVAARYPDAPRIEQLKRMIEQLR